MTTARPPAGDLTVGIDIGTTSVKAVAADAGGRVVARVRLPHRLIVPAPRRLEHDAAEAWWDGPRRALTTLRLDGVRAVAVSAMAPAWAAVDGGRPIGNGLLYGDERGEPPSRETRDDPMANGETTRLVRWLARAHPAAAGFWPPQAVAHRALAGEAVGERSVIDYGSAFSAGALFDGDDWDAKGCLSCGIEPAQLPAVQMFGEPVGEVPPDGSGPRPLLVTGSVDAFCEQLVSGVERPGEVLVVCGATLVVWSVRAGQPTVDGLWTLPSHLPDRSLVGGASNAGGLFLDWVDRVVAPADPATAAPGAVPVWLPFIRGERVPLFDPWRRAVAWGLDLTQGPAELRRAAYEASAFVARMLIERADARPQRLVVAGGGARVAPWLHALADVIGVPVEPVAVPEGAALGAAFLARVGAGLERSIGDAPRWWAAGEPVPPDPRWVGPAEERYQRYCEAVLRQGPD